MNDENILKRHLQPAARELGLPFVNWRCLRTSHATWLVQAGADPKSVQGQCGTRASRPRWISTRKLSPQHSAARWRSYRNSHGPIHGPLRSNKTGSSMVKSGCSSRQVVERFGGASRDRTDDLIVANDGIRRSHVIDSTRHYSVFEHLIHPICGTRMGQACPDWFCELGKFLNRSTLCGGNDLSVDVHRGRNARVSHLTLHCFGIGSGLHQPRRM